MFGKEGASTSMPFTVMMPDSVMFGLIICLLKQKIFKRKLLDLEWFIRAVQPKT